MLSMAAPLESSSSSQKANLSKTKRVNALLNKDNAIIPCLPYLLLPQISHDKLEVFHA